MQSTPLSQLPTNGPSNTGAALLNPQPPIQAANIEPAASTRGMVADVHPSERMFHPHPVNTNGKDMDHTHTSIGGYPDDPHKGLAMQRQMAVQDFPLPQSTFDITNDADNEMVMADALSRQAEQEASIEDTPRRISNKKEREKERRSVSNKHSSRNPKKNKNDYSDEEEDYEDDEDEDEYVEYDEYEDDKNLNVYDEEEEIESNKQQQTNTKEKSAESDDDDEFDQDKLIDSHGGKRAVTTVQSQQNKTSRSTVMDDIHLAVACALAFVIISIVPFESLLSLIAPSLNNVSYICLLIRTVLIGFTVFILVRFVLPPIATMQIQ